MCVYVCVGEKNTRIAEKETPTKPSSVNFRKKVCLCAMLSPQAQRIYSIFVFLPLPGTRFFFLGSHVKSSECCEPDRGHDSCEHVPCPCLPCFLLPAALFHVDLPVHNITSPSVRIELKDCRAGWTAHLSRLGCVPYRTEFFFILLAVPISCRTRCLSVLPGRAVAVCACVCLAMHLVP